MTDQDITDQEYRSEPPQTGVDEIDAALADLADLDGRPVAEQHDRMSRVHETLHNALQQPADDEPPTP